MIYSSNISGKECIVFGSGPSLNNWDDTRLLDAVRVSCNTCIFSDNINRHDYFFIQDNGCSRAKRPEVEPNCYLSRKEEYDSFKPTYGKFYGTGVNNKQKRWSLTNQDVNDGDAIPYSLKTLNMSPIDDTDYITELHSVALSAAQFAIHSKCTHLYIVGCDCTAGERFSGKCGVVTTSDNYKEGWNRLYNYMKLMSIPYTTF